MRPHDVHTRRTPRGICCEPLFPPGPGHAGDCAWGYGARRRQDLESRVARLDVTASSQLERIRPFGANHAPPPRHDRYAVCHRVLRPGRGRRPACENSARGGRRRRRTASRLRNALRVSRPGLVRAPSSLRIRVIDVRVQRASRGVRFPAEAGPKKSRPGRNVENPRQPIHSQRGEDNATVRPMARNHPAAPTRRLGPTRPRRAREKNVPAGLASPPRGGASTKTATKTTTTATATKTTHVCRADILPTSRDDAAAVRRGHSTESRRRRGHATWTLRGDDLQSTPRLRRGYFDANASRPQDWIHDVCEDQDRRRHCLELDCCEWSRGAAPRGLDCVPRASRGDAADADRGRVAATPRTRVFAGRCAAR